MPDRTCSIDGCLKASHARGWCVAHYARWERNGDPSGGLPSPGRPLSERFWAKVERGEPDECWLWPTESATGYGSLWHEGRTLLAHRVAYELLVGPIPEGLQLDHLCRVRQCVNPAHLEPVTIGENVLRGVGLTAQNLSKVACPAGHPLDEVNTYWYRGERSCRECRREATRRWRARARST